MEFDPTPKLKSSLEPIHFIPFNNNENKCGRCMAPYSKTILYEQKYCKNCLFWYINAAENDFILDVYIGVPSRYKSQVYYMRNIKEWRDGCSEILFFRQVSPGQCSKIIDRESGCALCGKSYQETSNSSIAFRLCPDCYQISGGRAESTPTIPILNLPWWDTSAQCKVCQLDCISSNCQKLCSACCTTYVGCRFCLTTNIIFGLTNKSQCKKCKRITHITDIGIGIGRGNIFIDEFLNANNFQNSWHVGCFVKNKNPNQFGSVYDFLKRNIRYTSTIRWILYSEIKNLVKIAKDGFSMMYKGTWSKRTIAIKKFRNPHQFTDFFFLYKLKLIQLRRELAFNIIKWRNLNTLVKENKQKQLK